MATENVGNQCANQSSVYGAAYSCIACASVAGNNGTITAIQAYGNQNLINCEFATMVADSPPLGGNPENFTKHAGDNSSAPTFTAGSCDQLDAGIDFTAFACDAGDYAGLYWTSGNIEAITSGAGADDYTDSGDHLDDPNNAYFQRSGYELQFRFINTYSIGTTVAPTTLAPTTLPPTTLAPTTLAPTTLPPTTLAPTTLAPTTLQPTTSPPTTKPPTTAAPTTLAPTTLPPTTLAPTTAPPTEPPTTIVAPTTLPPTTLAPTTAAPTTVAPTTPTPTTAPPTTVAPTTLAPTTLAPTTLPPTTLPPTTVSPTTSPPTTLPPTTLAPTTVPPTTLAPTTWYTTAAPTTLLTTSPPNEAMLVFKIGTANPPAQSFGRIWKNVSLGGAAGMQLIGAVPAGWYFQVVEQSPTGTKWKWWEVTW